MNKILWKFLLIAGGAFCVSSTMLAGGGSASALTGSNADLTAIGLLDGMMQCYGNGTIKGSGIQRSGFNSGAINAMINSSKNEDGQVWIPTMVGNTITDSNLSCKEVFTGYRENKKSNSIKGLNSRFKSSKEPSFYGYVPDDTKNEQQAGDKNVSSVSITLGVEDGSGNNSKGVKQSGTLVCNAKYKFKDRWVFEDYYYWEITSCTSSTKLTYESNDQVFIEFMGGGQPFGLASVGQYGPDTNDMQGGGATYVSLSWTQDHFNTHTILKVDEGTTFEKAFRDSDIYKWMEDDVRLAFQGVYSDPESEVKVTAERAADLTSGASANSYYKFLDGNGNWAGRVAGNNLAAGKPYMIGGSITTGGESYPTAYASWSDKYVYNLYFQYLSNIMESDEYKGKVTLGDCGKNKPSSGYYYKQKSDSWCKINFEGGTADTAKSKELAVVKSGHLAKGSFEDVLKWFKKEDNYKYLTEADYAGGTSPVAPEETDEAVGEGNENQETACQQAAGSLSWVVCPVMSMLNDATQGIYNNMIKPILQVNAKAVEAGDNNGVYEAWKTFRNYANIAFAIALALVILSQLTGIGLSNYNIKRILPRLIMVIVLVNISFILCQLAVDISNILGSALQDQLVKIANGIGGNTTAIAESKFLGGDVLKDIMGKFLATAATGGLTILGITAAAMTWDIWLVPLILILITFLLSIIFFFIILAVRQAGIFILIALAPAAIICYALPNTKSLFDKWYKLFSALLIAYPICGLMMGGGQLAAAILMNVSVYTEDNGFFMMLVAIVVSVAPFFLIPSVIKNSMGALGNIGAKLSNFGSKAGGFLGGVFMGSRFGDRVKRRADERTANRDEARAYRAQGRQLIRDTKALNRLRNREAAGEILSLDERELAGRLSNRVLAAEKSRNANRLRGGQMLDAGGVGELIKRQNRGQTDELEKAEVANTLAQYQHGEINGVDFSQLNAYDSYDVNGAGIGSLNSNSLEAEYGRQLDALSRNPEDAEALRKVKALQQHFATQGDSGRAVMQRAFESRLASGNIAGLSKATQAIASDSRTLGDIKGADRGLFAMVNDINSGRARTGAGAAAYYGSRGTDKYNAQSLVNADEGALNRLVARTNDGTITGGDLNSLAGSAREALSNPNINVKPEQEAALRQLANAGYAQGASSSATSGTAGSNAMAASSAANINSAASYIRGMNGGSRFSSSANAANNADYKMIQGMAQNAQTALQDSTKTYDQDQVKAMQDVIKAARDMGVSNDVGNTFDNVNPTRIQIRGVEARSMPTPPAGFSPDGVWIGGGSGPNPAQQAAVDQYLRERASTERYNRQHGFGPGSGGTP